MVQQSGAHVFAEGLDQILTLIWKFSAICGDGLHHPFVHLLDEICLKLFTGIHQLIVRGQGIVRVRQLILQFGRALVGRGGICVAIHSRNITEIHLSSPFMPPLAAQLINELAKSWKNARTLGLLPCECTSHTVSALLTL